MELGREIAEGIRRVEEEVYDGTSLDNTKLGQRDESRSGCVRLCDRRSIVNEM